MINAISITYLSLILFFFKDRYSYQAYVIVAMVAVYAFTIFQKYSYFIKNLNILSQIKKHLIAMALYKGAITNVLLGVLYFLTANRIIYFICVLLLGAELLFIEIKNILNYKIYEQIYLILSIICFLIGIYLFIKTIVLMQYTMTTYFIILTYIVLSIYISKKCYYWEHKKTLFNLIDTLIKQNRFEKTITEAAVKSVSEDYFLTECNNVMKSSFIRISSLNQIVAYFTKKLTAVTKDRKLALKESSDLCILLMQKLMNRRYDYSITPRFIVEPFQELFRWKSFLKNKSV